MKKTEDSVEIRRAGILDDYFSGLKNHQIQYCIVRGHDNIISRPEKDIDLMVMPKDFLMASTIFSDIVEKHSAIEVTNFIKGKSLYMKAAIVASDSRKIGTIYIHAVAYALIKTSKWQIGKPGAGNRLWVTDIDTVDADINGVHACIPSVKYQKLLLMARYLQYPKPEYLSQIKNLAESESHVTGLNINDSIDTEVTNTDHARKTIFESLNALYNSSVTPSLIKSIYHLSILLFLNIFSLTRKRGRLIFFSGPDGSGKTTANTLLSEFLQKNLGIHVINVKHLYPSSLFLGKQSRKLQAKIRGINENDAVSLERDRGNSRSWRMRRLLGLLFLLAQIWPGYLWARYKNRQGYFVIVDTSFFDVFIKGHRPAFPILERISAPLIPCGDLWLVMKASPEKIISRKPELTIDEITNYYISINRIQELSNCKTSYINSENGIELVLSQILACYGVLDLHNARQS